MKFLNNILSKLSGFLDGKNSLSSLRLNLFIITIGVFIIMLSIAAYIIIVGIVDRRVVDFYGIASIIVSLGVFLAMVYYQKNLQSKYFLQQKNNNQQV